MLCVRLKGFSVRGERDDSGEQKGIEDELISKHSRHGTQAEAVERQQPAKIQRTGEENVNGEKSKRPRRVKNRL